MINNLFRNTKQNKYIHVQRKNAGQYCFLVQGATKRLIFVAIMVVTFTMIELHFATKFCK